MNWEKVKLVSAGAIGGAFVLASVGFGWGGWMFERKAEQLAQKAVIDRLIPICVAQFMEDPERKEKLAKLGKVDFVKQAAYVEQQGWATIPGRDDPNSKVAELCVREIQFTNL